MMEPLLLRIMSNCNKGFKITAIVVLSLMLLHYSGSFPQLAYSQNSMNEKFVLNMSDNAGDSVYPQISSYNDNVYVVWQDNVFDDKKRNYDILLKTSTDGGQTFGDVVNLSNNSGFSEHPQIAINGNNVYVVWADKLSANREILYIKSTDGGQTFGDVVNLSNNAKDSFNQEIAVNGNNVYVVWQDRTPGSESDGTISIMTSTDGGQTFGDVVNLSKGAGKTAFPKVASYNDSVYVVWNNDDENKVINYAKDRNGSVYFTKSNDNGKSFAKEIKLNPNSKAGEAQILANGNNIHVVWTSPGTYSDPFPSPTTMGNESGSSIISNNSNGSMFLTTSSDNGKSFAKPVALIEGLKNPLNTEITEYSNKLYIVTQASIDNTAINQDIFVRESIDKGNTFGKAINISNNPGFSECPSITFSGNNMYLIWQDKATGNNEAFYTQTKLN